MLEVIEKLLLLQDRDREILHLETELSAIEPQRRLVQSKTERAKKADDDARQRLRQLESERKELELEVVSKSEQIERYELQQYQTRKNEEYRALTHEIDTCKAAILKIEDRELELMEQAEAAQTQIKTLAREAESLQRESDRQLAELADREATLRQRLADLRTGRAGIAASVGEAALPRYERLRQSKAGRAVVGVEHSACGGCHVQLPPQVVLECRSNHEIVLCPNCGRILYYTRDMDLAVAD